MHSSNVSVLLCQILVLHNRRRNSYGWRQPAFPQTWRPARKSSCCRDHSLKFNCCDRMTGLTPRVRASFRCLAGPVQKGSEFAVCLGSLQLKSVFAALPLRGLLRDEVSRHFQRRGVSWSLRTREGATVLLYPLMEPWQADQ